MIQKRNRRIRLVLVSCEIYLLDRKIILINGSTCYAQHIRAHLRIRARFHFILIKSGRLLQKKKQKKTGRAHCYAGTALSSSIFFYFWDETFDA